MLSITSQNVGDSQYLRVRREEVYINKNSVISIPLNWLRSTLLKYGKKEKNRYRSVQDQDTRRRKVKLKIYTLPKPKAILLLNEERDCRWERLINPKEKKKKNTSNLILKTPEEKVKVKNK